MQLIGQDTHGNQYYLSDISDYLGRRRRVVKYKSDKDPSVVPPMWHAWLHYLLDEVPSETTLYKWQVQHEANQTGSNPYIPTWDSVESKYEPWKPE